MAGHTLCIPDATSRWRIIPHYSKIMRIKSTLFVMILIGSSALGATKVSFDAADNLVIDGKTVFPISVAVLPPVDGKTPSGEAAWKEFADAGVNFARIGPT